MKFSYIAILGNGQTKKGEIEASSIREATKALLAQGLYIKKIGHKKAIRNLPDLIFGRISLVEKLLFAKHLSTMISSGITITEALEVIAEQTTSKRFKKIITRVREAVSAGQSLSVALANYPRIFTPLFINIIKVGEESGTLQENLEYLADDLEERLDLKRKIKSATLYPVIILVATFGLGLILAYFVLPKITHLFKTLHFQLPLTTRILLAVAEIIEQYGNYILLAIFVGLVSLRILFALKLTKPFFHWLNLKLPLLGKIVRDYHLAIFCRTLKILLKSGLTLDQALEITANTSGNVIYQRKIKLSISGVRKGKSLADTLASFRQSKRNPLFPLMVIKMIGVGEKSGQLENSFVYLTKYFDKEVDTTTKNLTIILEPILLVFIGLVVGFVAISVISPIYQVTAQFRY